MFQSGLGYCLLRLEQFEEAETVLLEAEEHLLAMVGPDHPWTRSTRDRLAQLYDAWEKPDRAAEWRARLPAATEPERDD